jgi:hypothetical protein
LMELVVDKNEPKRAPARNIFQLQFPASEVAHLAKRYSYEEDKSVLEAGRRISRGDYSRANIEVIFRRKTQGRGISRLHVLLRSSIPCA